MKEYFRRIDNPEDAKAAVRKNIRGQLCPRLISVSDITAK